MSITHRIARQSLVLALALCLSIPLAGCPGTGGSLLGFLVEVSSTGAVVGGKGRIRITLREPAASNMSIGLTSGDVGVATVPASVGLPAGRVVAEFEYDGVAAGAATITANIDGATLSTIVSVVPALALSSVSGPGLPLETGARSTFAVALNIAVAEDTTIALATSDANVVTLPAEAVVRPFSSSATVFITGDDVGTARLSATFDGATRDLVLSVVDEPIISSLSGLGTHMVSGLPASLTIGLNAVAASNKTIDLSSSHDAVVTLPSSAVVPAGSSSASVPVQVLDPGTATITATLNGSTREQTTSVVNAPGLSTLSVASRMAVGGLTTLSVFLDATAVADTTVAISSSNLAVLPVPASVVIPAGTSFSSAVQLQALSPGEVTLTAELDGVEVVARVSVIAEPVLISASHSFTTVQTGVVEFFSASLDQAALEDTVVTLSSSDPAIITVPPTLTIFNGSSSGSVLLRAMSHGTAVVTATLDGVTAGDQLHVVQTPSISASVTSFLEVGAATAGFVQANAVPAADETVILTNHDPTIVSVNLTPLLRAGSTSTNFLVRALAPGAADVDFTAFGSTAPLRIIVVMNATLSGIGTNTPRVGRSALGQVQMDAIVADDTTVLLSSSDTTSVIVPPSVVVPAGGSIGRFHLAGVSANTAIITATLGATMVTTSVTPTP